MSNQVDGELTSIELDPIDWQQFELLARMTPAQRFMAMAEASEFAVAGLRGAFCRRFPDLSPSEINMKVLEYVTPLRGWKPDWKTKGEK